MGAGHVHALYVHGHGRVHRLAPQAKLVSLFGFVLAVVCTPRDAFWAFGAYLAIVAGASIAADLSPALVLRRLAIELPFLAFALFLPFIGQGEQVDVGPLTLSVAGLWGMWSILAKGTLAVAASTVITATTSVPEIIVGLDRLRMPRAVTGIAGFMVRYLDLTVAEARRMSIARQARGHDPRWIWQARATASSAGVLFIRSFERGERVHLAMVSRGYDGSMPRADLTGGDGDRPVGAATWLLTLVPALLAATVCLLAWGVR